MIITKKGTELPLLNLKGKDYLQVAWRIVWFREEHPLGRIDTTLVESTDKFVIFSASISIPDPTSGDYIKLADSVKREDFAHFADANEKAQTGAIGRALALCGFGTQHAPDLDEEDRVVDSPLNLNKTDFGIHPEQPTLEDGILDNGEYKVPFGKFKQRSLEEIGVDELRSYVGYLENKAKKDNKAITGIVADFIHRASEYIGSFEMANFGPLK